MLVGVLLAVGLTAGFASTASAETASTAPVAAPVMVLTAATPSAMVPPVGTQVELCLMNGDTMEVRAAIGAVIGALAGLPIFIVGAIPGALVGAGLGALSWQIASWSAHTQGGCTH
ncbi:hypothetical protein K7711_06155 [Nocardia sp. CA2R105]|uniref:hypothetical protein n=1 Tax=Nocardia coffeae TaxID=2873381 RepID=UPI001CA69C54|nr:hypothetical protein [Nocardia coffeae]MBY8856054.1 hypothetical protein [Nocardia coffeae]